MYQTKSKDRDKYFSKKHSYVDNYKRFDYDTQMNKANRAFKDRNLNEILNKTSQIEIEEKTNQNMFKDLQKCNQKMEYYKLLGSLQQQKRNILFQENAFLKTENQQLKGQIESYKKQNHKLTKKLNKLSFQLQSEKQRREGHQNDFIIEIPQKNKSRTNVNKRSPPQKQAQQQVTVCSKCIQMLERLDQERYLYEKDRNYLKQQIDNLNEILEDTKKYQKIRLSECQDKSLFTQEKEAQIVQRFRKKQNELKNELTFCYRAFQQKCKMISHMQGQIDFFQQQNQRILKILALFDKQKLNSHNLAINLQNDAIKRHPRAISAYDTKMKAGLDLNLINKKSNTSEQYLYGMIQNKRQNRKCGSIKKVQGKQ